jgi:hypothetical protein
MNIAGKQVNNFPVMHFIWLHTKKHENVECTLKKAEVLFLVGTLLIFSKPHKMSM